VRGSTDFVEKPDLGRDVWNEGHDPCGLIDEVLEEGRSGEFARRFGGTTSRGWMPSPDPPSTSTMALTQVSVATA
jgi:hypothetical protein